MHIALFIISMVTVVVLIAALIIDRKILKSDVFSPVSVFIYFSFLSTFSLIWFSVSKTAIYELTFPQVASIYRDETLVILSYAFHLASILITYFGMIIGCYVKFPTSNIFFSRIFGVNSLYGSSLESAVNMKNRSERFGLLFVTLGACLYSFYIIKIGGIVELWLDLHNRVERAEGLGYVYYGYKFLLVFGSLLYLASSLRTKKVKSILLILFVSLVLVSLGQRGPVVAYIFSIVIVYNYRVRRIKEVISIRNSLIFLIFIAFILSMVQFRTPGKIEYYKNDPSALITDSASSFEKHFVDRLSSIERSIAILGYFNNHDVWKGASYLGLILAPIPRGYFDDKPPVDTGRYVLSIAQGNIVNPPVSLNQLPSSSWPEGNWAGYMNFHLPGFVLAYFFSGVIFGWIGQLPRSTNYKLLPVIFYAMMAWGGGINLSPYGLVNLIMAFGLFFVASFFIRLRIRPFKFAFNDCVSG